MANPEAAPTKIVPGLPAHPFGQTGSPGITVPAKKHLVIETLSLQVEVFGLGQLTIPSRITPNPETGRLRGLRVRWRYYANDRSQQELAASHFIDLPRPWP
jgi:hypothetical protein